MNDDALVCYVIMRTDLDSLNPGKAMAQAHHAYGALKNAARSNLVMQPDYVRWQRITEQDFGTVIVLGGIAVEIQQVLDTAKRIKKYVLSGWVHDPTYPIQDGDVTHLVPLNTCAFVFGAKADCADVVKHFKLHA